jgi:hypothetical protein
MAQQSLSLPPHPQSKGVQYIKKQSKDIHLPIDEVISYITISIQTPKLACNALSLQAKMKLREP